MDNKNLFTAAEAVLINQLFKRIFDRGGAPIVLYATDNAGQDFAVFNPAITNGEAEHIGEAIHSALGDIAIARMIDR
jgi:hypothetical protein